MRTATAKASESNKKAAKVSAKGSSKSLSKSIAMPKLVGSKPQTKAASKEASKANSKVLPKAAPAAQPASEDEEDDMDMAEGSSSGGGTAMPKVEEMTAAAPMTPKNFRNHPDMENFFRFIYENDLRYEALQIIDQIILARADKRASKKPNANA